MSKQTKIVHFTIVDGTEEQVKSLSQALSKIKDKLNFEMEFLVTNDRIQLTQLPELINQLITLYKREEGKLKILRDKIKDEKNNKGNKVKLKD